MGSYSGDYERDSMVCFCWDTNDRNGASASRQVNGIIKVYKDGGAAGTTEGVFDTEDFNGLTGVHCCGIDLSADEFYAAGHDYSVVLAGAEIDGEAVNAVLTTFSIENRFAGSELFRKAAKLLVNKAVQTKITGEIVYYDDDGETVMLTHTPADDETSITRMPS
jgi:hypothetical protein